MFYPSLVLISESLKKGEICENHYKILIGDKTMENNEMPDYNVRKSHDEWAKEEFAWLDVPPTREDIIDTDFCIDSEEDLMYLHST